MKGRENLGHAGPAGEVKHASCVVVVHKWPLVLA